MWTIRKSTYKSEQIGLYPLEEEFLHFIEQAFHVYETKTGVRKIIIMNIEMLLLIGTLALLDMFSPSIIGVSVYVLLVAKTADPPFINLFNDCWVVLL